MGEISIGVEGKFTFSASHVLSNHPKCGRIHGHNYAVDVELSEPNFNLKGSGMVMDFGEVKKVVNKHLDELDHKFLVPMLSKDYTVGMDTVNPDDTEVAEIRINRETFPDLVIKGAKADFAFLPLRHITAEVLSQYLYELMKREIVLLKSVKVWETNNYYAKCGGN